MTNKISINGQAASFHHQVVKTNFRGDEPVFCQDFKEVFANVNNGVSDFGLVAIENSLYGSINEVDALLLETGLQITGEYYLRINFCLLGLPKTKINQITNVYSQDIALAQCHSWLDKNLSQAKVYNYGDTAGAANFVTQTGNNNLAAVASQAAAELYGLEVIAEEIENDKQNFTRFVTISKTANTNKANKTSAVIWAANKPGSLHEVLGIFKNLDINLTKLDSKPIAGKPWEYMFYVDFEAGIEDESTKSLISQLNNNGHEVKILGSYKAGEYQKA
jgi:prephenate dehydratase